MSDTRRPYPDAEQDAGVLPAREPTTGAPRWVKLAGIPLAILLVLIVAMMLLGGGGGGQHGPGRHSGTTPADSTSGGTDGAGGGHVPPAGRHG